MDSASAEAAAQQAAHAAGRSRNWRVDLSGTVSVVVGASGGIGQAIALGLVDAGSTVVATAREVSRLEETRAEADGGRGQLHAETVDIRSEEDIRRFADAVVEMHGVPVVLVNAAGVMVPKPALELAPEDWDATLDTQLRGPFFTCQAFARHMATVRYGKIINLSSTWAVTVAPGRSAYCAAKAGLSHLTAALAQEWADLGIRVNAVAPTATLTPAIIARNAAHPERDAWFRDRIPLGRMATPEDITGAALFLASTASDFITGETILVDGGWRASK